jgi:hypothetical protein
MTNEQIKNQFNFYKQCNKEFKRAVRNLKFIGGYNYEGGWLCQKCFSFHVKDKSFNSRFIQLNSETGEVWEDKISRGEK